MTRTTILLLTSLLLSLSTPLKATEFFLKNEIPRLQKKFGHSSPWPIVIMDKEELQWRFAQKKAIGEGEDKRVKRQKIIQSYIKEKVGVEITLSEADQYDPFLNALKENAFALPILKSTYPAVYKLCAVFPASEFSNQRLEHNRILGLDTKVAHQGKTYDELEVRLPFETLARFSLYHELSHCRDEWFMPGTFDYEDPHQVHLSESFAEVSALLMMQAEGYSNIAKPRAQLRALYSYNMGRYFALNPQLGFGNPFFIAGGAVYYLTDSLLAAENIQTLDIQKTAKSIVDKNALPQRGFTAIVNWLGAPLSTWDKYEAWAKESPDLFLEAFETLKKYSNTAPIFAQGLFSEEQKFPPESSTLLEWDLSLCESFLAHDHSQFQQQLYEYLTDLRAEHGSPQDQKRRYQEFANLYSLLQDSCAAH
ncbi:MAG: hypothetical protein K2P81_09955 [Bacteriovoracaceae bacterium]|nr:hypothetical protein [Bacteriovoracaceae bacterium]